MKLLSVNLARSIWLGPISDFNPKGVSLYNILFPFLVNTYKFRKFPSLTESSDLSKGISFQDGEFKIGDDLPVTVNFNMYNDGVVADTSASTAYSDAFLEEVYTKFSEVFKIPPYQSILRKKTYLSQLFVSTNKSLEVINPKMKSISKYLSDYVEEGGKVFQFTGVSFAPDQVNRINPPPFTFARAANVAFVENRYYSEAPLPTDKHLELLDKLESILSKTDAK